MKCFIFFIFSISLSILSYSQELNCRIASLPQASEIKVTYDQDRPAHVFLRAPEEADFRQLHVSVDVIFQNDERDESFLVKPIYDQPIDWKQEPHCYKEVGTQWYFIIQRTTQDYLVQFTPHLIIQPDQQCQTPRFTPQNHKLICEQ